MSGGSQHNPNGRQAQLGAGWSPLQLQVASFLARAPQAHMGPERGVTWHTPTPPPHLYHVPAPSPPDPLQAMKASGNSVFRHTATPPDIYRHTPTPPDKHMIRHTPSPGDVKSTGAGGLPPSDIYPHLAPARDKVVRAEELVGYSRGVDLSVSGRSSSNGAAAAPITTAASSPALSVRDAPTINSLIARAQPRAGHVRVDTLLERLSVSPASPHSVIVHPPVAPTAPPPRTRALPTPSPPSSNEDSADSCGAPPGSKRKRKPERIVRVSAPPPAPAPAASPSPSLLPAASPSPTPTPTHRTDPVENGDTCPTTNGPPTEPKQLVPPPTEKHPQNEPTTSPHTPTREEKQSPPQTETCKRKTRANSAETIDDIAAMIASTAPVVAASPPTEPGPTVTIDKLKSVLASPTTNNQDRAEAKKTPPREDKPEPSVEEAAAAPKRRATRTSNSESTNVPVESPSEAKPAETDTTDAPTAEPTAASFVEVENQLEKMFAGLEDAPKDAAEGQEASKPKKRRKSAPTKGDAKAGRRGNRAATVDGRRGNRTGTVDGRRGNRSGTVDGRRKGAKKKNTARAKKEVRKEVKDAYAYDSGSNASSSRSRGPYIQIRGPSDSPLSVSVMNAANGEEENESTTRRKTGDEFRNGLRAKGLHASTLGLRYDATTPDATWLCAFCLSGPHKHGLGDLFGPYQLSTDCDEYRSLDEATRLRYESSDGPNEVWFHELCAVWAPGVLAAGARLWGLPPAVWAARAERCHHCARQGATLACSDRRCRARAHVPCARTAHWTLDETTFRPSCPAHAPA